jgi:hypothetical protein
MKKSKPPKPMTLAERIQYGTTDYLELATGFLGASPEWPGGCETLARITLPKERLLVNKELFDYLVDEALENITLRQQLELLGGSD